MTRHIIHAALSAMLDPPPRISVQRLRGDETLLDAVKKLSEGNPGAITSIAALMDASPTFDRDALLGAWAPLLNLDRCGIYGANVYSLHHDMCKGNAVATLACLRAVQLGYVPEARLLHAIAVTDVAFPLACLDVVRAHLPSFGGDHGS